MKRIFLTLMITSLLVGCSSSDNNNSTGPAEYTPSASQLLTETFTSTALGEDREVQVYLPPGYDDAEMADSTYALIVFLHGANSTPENYSGLAKAVIDNAINSGAIHNVIVAFPNSRGGVEPFQNPFYTNSVANGDYEDYIINDVINYMDSNYRTVGTAAERAIMGHSMGGYGSMTLALKHPDMFAAVASHSGPIDFAPFPALIPAVLQEQGGQAPYTFTTIDTSTVFTFLSWSMATAFSPDLDAPFFSADFPIDSDGNFDQAVFDRWLTHDPSIIAVQQSANISNLGIYFDCGSEDELGVYPMDVAFDSVLTANSIAHTWQSYSGTHTSGLLTRFPVSLAFLDAAMHPAMATMAFASR